MDLSDLPGHHITEGDAWRHATYPENDPPMCDPDEIPMNAVRSEFGAGTTSVFGWPTSGGVWVHSECYAVELDFLHLPRFEPAATARWSPEEDAFCKHLEYIGATFFESELAYNQQQVSRPKYEIWYGWPGVVPEDGVWALRTTFMQGSDLGVSRIRNAVTMQERCEVIEKLGGKFYERWEDIPWVESSVDGIKVEL